MRTPIFLTVVLALVMGMAGVATADDRGWRQHHAFSHDGPNLHGRDHHRAITSGFWHHRGKHVEHRGGHRSVWKHRRHPDGHYAAWKHRRHHAHRPAFAHPHRGGPFVFARDPFGSSIKIIIGDRRGHGRKRHHHRGRH
jgi:hypothetical protein